MQTPAGFCFREGGGIYTLSESVYWYAMHRYVLLGIDQLFRGESGGRAVLPRGLLLQNVDHVLLNLADDPGMKWRSVNDHPFRFNMHFRLLYTPSSSQCLAPFSLGPGSTPCESETDARVYV